MLQKIIEIYTIFTQSLPGTIAGVKSGKKKALPALQPRCLPFSFSRVTRTSDSTATKSLILASVQPRAVMLKSYKNWLITCIDLIYVYLKFAFIIE
jgi:hypothetical protein